MADKKNPDNTTQSTVAAAIPNLQVQAIVGEVRRMLRLELEAIHDRIDRVEQVAPQKQARAAPPLVAPNATKTART